MQALQLRGAGPRYTISAGHPGIPAADQSQGKDPDQVRASVITHWVQVYDLRKAQYLAGHRTLVRRSPTNSRCSMSCRRT